MRKSKRSPVRSSKTDKLERVLILPDTHVPYEDKRAWALLLQVIKAVQFQKIIILGDFWDCYSVSAHAKDPNRIHLIEQELEQVNGRLDELDASGAKEKFYIEGNHEFRLPRQLQDKLPQLYNIVRVEKLLKLKERGWQYIPYMDDMKAGLVYATHCVGSSSSAQKAFLDYQDNVLTGHNHAMDYIVRGNAKGIAHVSATFGWLGDVRAVDYMHKVKARKNWVLGFGVGYLRPSNGFMYLVPVPLVDYSVCVEGKLFLG